MTTEQSTSDTSRFGCPDCKHGTLQVSDGIYSDCDTCGTAVERNEVRE